MEKFSFFFVEFPLDILLSQTYGKSDKKSFVLFFSLESLASLAKKANVNNLRNFLLDFFLKEAIIIFIDKHLTFSATQCHRSVLVDNNEGPPVYTEFKGAFRLPSIFAQPELAVIIDENKHFTSFSRRPSEEYSLRDKKKERRQK